MSVRFDRENIETGRALRATPQQMAVEGEILLPGGLRDEVRVLHTDAEACALQTENTGNRVTVSGRVAFHVLYAQGDLTRVRSAETLSDFSRALTVARTEATAEFQPQCEVTGVQARVFNGRLLLKAEMNVYAEATEVQEAAFITNVQEPSAQVLKREMTVQRTVGGGSAQGLVRGEFEVADALQAQEALQAQAEARVEDVIGGADGRAAVTGTIDLTACFASGINGRPLVYAQYSLPFEQPVTLSGEAGDMLSASAQVTDVAVALEGDEKGKALRAEIGLQVRIDSLKEQKTQLVTDVFATGDEELQPQSVATSVRTQVINTHAAESGRIQLLLPEGAPRIKTVLAAFAHPVLAGAKENGGRLNVDMLMRATLIYMTEDSGIPVSHTTEEPLRLSFACEGAAEDMLSLTVSHVEASMVASDRAEIRCVATLHVSGARYEAVSAVTDILSEQAGKDDRCLAMYITQPQERLWDVMKRYRLSEAAVKALNEETAEYAPEDMLPVAMRLIAYR